MLDAQLGNNDSDETDSDEDEDDYEEDEFDSYETLLDGEDAEDEFILFRQTLEHIQSSDKEVYTLLASKLNKDQFFIIEDIYTQAKQREESRGLYFCIYCIFVFIVFLFILLICIF